MTWNEYKKHLMEMAESVNLIKMDRDAVLAALNRIAILESKVVPKPKGKDYSPGFLRWWDIYPRKEGKGAAYKAWQAATRTVLVSTIDKKTEQYRAAWDNWSQAQRDYTPMPATWLNQRRWEDDPAEWNKGKAERTW